MMHPLIAFALQFCPRAFRDEYRAEIAVDTRDATSVLLDSFDLIRMGIFLRAERIANDIVFALRMLTKMPMVTIVAAGTMSLAIAVNVAAASTVAGILLRPLPFPDSGRLVYAEEYVSRQAGLGATSDVRRPSYADFQRFSQGNRTFDTLVAAYPVSDVLTLPRANAFVRGLAVSSRYFETYGLHPQMGRLLIETDANTAHIVISNSAWKSVFNGDRAIIGRSVTLGGRSATIVGVLAPGFRDLSRGLFLSFDYWMPLRSAGLAAGNYLSILGRLHAGVSPAAAQADLSRIAADIGKRIPAESDLDSVRITSMATAVIGDRAPLLWLLYAGAIVVLLIACVNVANLCVVRNGTRERELALRGALGGSRADIVGLLCVEAALLAVFSGILGIGVGYLMLHTFAGLGDSFAPQWSNVVIDWRIAAYTLGLVVVVTIATGVLPALMHGKNVAAYLGPTARTGGRRGRTWVRAGMVIAQIALAFAVVMSAGLLTRSFLTLTRLDIGFDTRNAYAVLSRESARVAHASQSERIAMETRELGAISAIPGITAAAIGSGIPFLYGGDPISVTIPGRGARKVQTRVVYASPRYFDVLKIPLLRGRPLSAYDSSHAAPRILVNAAFSDRLFPGSGALSQTVNVETAPGTFRARAIVGIVGNTRNSLGGTYVPTIYVSADQSPEAGMIVVRTSHPMPRVAEAIARVASSIDPTSLNFSLYGLEAQVGEQVSAQRTITLFFVTLASIALLLALAGTYAVTSSAAEQRLHEFGVRRAVGATVMLIVRDVLWKAVALGAGGIAIGIVIIAALSGQVNSLLFATSALDPLVIICVGTGLLLATSIAALIPALRAARLDPARVLGYE